MQGTGPYKSFSPLSSSKLFSSGASGWSSLVLNRTRHNSQKTENQQYAIHNYWKVISNTTDLLFLKLWVRVQVWWTYSWCHGMSALNANTLPRGKLARNFGKFRYKQSQVSHNSLVDYQSMTRNPVTGVSRISALLTCSYHTQENTLIPALCSYDALPTLLMEVLHY